MSGKPKDRWPKEWKRPLYGPEVIARDLIEAGKSLLKQVQQNASKVSK